MQDWYCRLNLVTSRLSDSVPITVVKRQSPPKLKRNRKPQGSRGKLKTKKPSVWLKALLIGFSVLALLASLLAYQVLKPLERRQAGDLDVHVSAGQGARAIAEDLQSQGLQVPTYLFAALTRLYGVDAKLKAGRYPVASNLSLLGLVDLLGSGKGLLSSVTLIEGATSAQFLQQLRARPDLVDDLSTDNAEKLAERFGVEGRSLEGWLYADTYKYAPGSKASDLIARAVKLQKSELLKAWDQRAPNLLLKTPYEALILASIVEKETGRASDRPKISSVFHNRLKTGMLLQTDPTVIYGVGSAFDGNLTKKHLQTDTPYNTYTRPGLPPTPIANPGQAALYAAVRPEDTRYYYFVAKGDGSSYFSQSLDEHNRAVRNYILNR